MNSSTNRPFGLFLFLVFGCCVAIQSQTIAGAESQTATNQSQTTTASKTSPNVVEPSLKGKGIAGIVVIARLANSDGRRIPTYRGVTDQEETTASKYPFRHFSNWTSRARVHSIAREDTILTEEKL
jgi:hypothetical protein